MHTGKHCHLKHHDDSIIIIYIYDNNIYYIYIHINKYVKRSIFIIVLYKICLKYIFKIYFVHISIIFLNKCHSYISKYSYITKYIHTYMYIYIIYHDGNTMKHTYISFSIYTNIYI